MSRASPTCECGFRYVVGSPDDEAQHKKSHAEYSLGPVIPQIRGLPAIATNQTFRLVLVDRTVPLKKRTAIAYVAMVARRCMPDYPAGYYGTVTAEDQRMYALVVGSRVVGMVLTALDDRFWRLAWKAEGGAQLLDDNALTHHGPKIARVWVAAKHRRRGLAKWLIEAVVAHLGAEIANVGWELPLTDSGKSLVKMICPDVFLGCGDGHTVWETIESEGVPQNAA